MRVELDRELLRAMAFARHPEVVKRFKGLALPEASFQWGFARVAYYGLKRKLYEPQDDGASMAFIIPVVEDGDLVDLAAVDGISEHVGQRFGHGHGLGLDAIAKARLKCCTLHLVERPLKWLRKQDLALREVVRFAREVEDIMGQEFKRPTQGPPDDFVYLFDLSEARLLFEDVPKIVCDSIVLAERLQATLPPSWRARVELPDV